MKIKFLNILVAIFAMTAFVACDDDLLYKADFNRFEVDGVKAVAGDESVVLTWAPQAGKPNPLEYLITWTSASTDAPGGNTIVSAEITSVEIKNLVNDRIYTFGVQARYPEGLAQKLTATCQPKSTRIPVSDFKAMAGDKRVYVAWQRPTTNLSYTYQLEISANGNVIKTFAPKPEANACLVDGLANGTEYTFTLTCIYGHGNSTSCVATAIPGEISPMAVVPGEPRPNELTKIEYNPAYFVMGEIASVEWSFADGTKQTTAAAQHCFITPGANKVTVTITYKDGQTESASTTVNVLPFAWSDLDGTGYQKSSTMVFSPNGQQMYTISQNTKVVYGINAITGAILWQYITDGATYGAGPAVAKNGSIIFGTEDGDGSVFALSPNGTLRWVAKLGNSIKAAPAVTSDGVVYALADGGKLAALDLETGAEKWTAQGSGNAGGVAVDKDGTVYFGTSDGVWAYSANGTQKWQSATLKVTARGGNVVISNDCVYATLAGKGGVVALDKASGAIKWQYKTTYGDCYNPVVDAEGTVYFNEKAGGLYAVKKDGTKKWEYTTDLNYTFNGFALGSDGQAYISQYAAPFNLLAFSANGTPSVVTNIGVQTMSPVTIGPDHRIYYGKNGSISAFNAGVGLAKAQWPCRGANYQATSSLR